MTFSYRQVTISGSNRDVEGTSAFLNEVTDVLVNEMGYLLEDDRRAQAGSSLEANTHKVVFNSNGGESGTSPNWYLTLTSGTAAAVGANTVGTRIHTDYDTGTHLATSGIEAPNTHTANTMVTDSDGQFVVWISGDKDGIVIVTYARNTWNTGLFGKSQAFLDETFEPYGLYLHTVTSTVNVDSANVRSIAGNPPEDFPNNAESEFRTYNLSNNAEPRTGIGPSDEAILSALPILHTVDDGSPTRKGAIGFVRNAWVAVNETAGILAPTLVTVAGSGQEYVVFGETGNSLVIRKS